MSRSQPPGTRLLSDFWHTALFRSCPYCGRWLALRFVRREHISAAMTVKVYRCKHCAREVNLAVQ